MIKPTVGRIVEYMQLVSSDVPFPAIITRVHTDTLVDLFVFTDVSTYPAINVHLQQDPNEETPAVYARWMVYQIGQAAKTEDLTAMLTTRLSVLEQHLAELKARFEPSAANDNAQA